MKQIKGEEQCLNCKTVFPFPWCKVSMWLHKLKIRFTESDAALKTLGVSAVSETTVNESCIMEVLLSSVLLLFRNLYAVVQKEKKVKGLSNK